MMKLLAGVEEVSDGETKDIKNGNTVNNNNHAFNDDKEAKKTCINQSAHVRPKEPAGSPIKGEVTPEDEEKMRRLLPIDEAPEYLTHNPFILHGYRGYLTTKLCIESVFWWTNETINIWSHIFGWMLFLGLTMYDLCLLNIHAPFGDKVIVALLLVCFQACMILSSVYHTFSCRSERDYWCFLCYDLFGIALSLLAIYMSGVYYAFWCHKELQQFYLITVLLIFIVAMVLQIPSLEVNGNVKLLVFVAWAVYGVLPTFHWGIAMGGMENPIVKMLIPRVLGMYLISGCAFAIYMSKIPERFCPGSVDYIGSSHQWWHCLVVLALYYWHNTGMLYVEYRMNHGCPTNMRVARARADSINIWRSPGKPWARLWITACYTFLYFLDVMSLLFVVGPALAVSFTPVDGTCHPLRVERPFAFFPISFLLAGAKYRHSDIFGYWQDPLLQLLANGTCDILLHTRAWQMCFNYPEQLYKNYHM